MNVSLGDLKVVSQAQAPASAGVASPEPGFAQPLSEFLETAGDWEKHKAAAQERSLQEALRHALGLKYAGEVTRCSTILMLQREKESPEFRVRPFESCKRRWCPVCAWRKSLAQWAKLVERLPGLIEQHGPVRWLLLTLTIRNCGIDDLPQAVDTLLRGFRTLTHPGSRLGRDWPATGWLRALEVTFPRPGEAHPHLHVMMAVKPSYFTHGYIKQVEWTNRWRQACKLDYDPVVDVRRVRPLSPAVAQAVGESLAEALGGLREVSKYVTKPADVAGNPDAARGLMLLRGRRFIDGGGWLRGVLKDIEEDGQLELPEMEHVAVFWWRAVEEKYRRRIDGWIPAESSPNSRWRRS